jgi:hypothetical protein
MLPIVLAQAATAVDPDMQLLAQVLDNVQNGNGWLAAGPALSLVVLLLRKYDREIPTVGPAIDRFLNQPLVAFLLPTVLSAATGLFSALAVHAPVGPAIFAALKVAGAAAFTFLLAKNGVEQMAGSKPPAPQPPASQPPAGPIGQVPPALKMLFLGALLPALMVPALLLSSCQHVEPALVTRDAMVTAEEAFEAVLVVMDALDPKLTDAQRASWELFKQRFRTSYHAARVLYDDAVDEQIRILEMDGGSDAVAESQANMKAAQQVLQTIMSQLGFWQSFIVDMGAQPSSKPTGGVL